ncbi:T9SS type A sorting domain-containing protein [Chitinophagaceae bacterium MMS25-I14]
MKCCYLFITLLFISNFASAQPSGLDSSFGVNGVANSTLPYSMYYSALTIDHNGNIATVASWNGTTVLNRFLNNGTPDNSFGLQSTYMGLGPFSGLMPAAMLQQPDGKLVAGGMIYRASSDFDFGLTRVKANGTPDSSFGNNGLVTTDLGTPAPTMEYIYALALQPDGRIIAMGTRYSQLALVRYLPNGSLDNSFANGGKLLAGIQVISPGAIAIQPDGKILVAAAQYGSPTGVYTCLRYFANGTPDSTFNFSGSISVPIGQFGAINAMQLQPDGKILVAGTNMNDGLLLRLTPAGQRDMTFGTNGIATLNRCAVTSLALRGNNRIVAAGYRSDNGKKMMLMQVKPDGNPDSSFGRYGSVITGLTPGDGQIQDIGLQPDGKVVACGWVTDSSTSSHTFPVVIRFQSDGKLDVPEVNATGPGIVLYPQPAHDIVQINTPGNTQVTTAALYTIDGRCISHPDIINNTLNTAIYPDGLYMIYLQLNANATPVVKKLLIRH